MTGPYDSPPAPASEPTDTRGKKSTPTPSARATRKATTPTPSRTTEEPTPATVPGSDDLGEVCRAA